MNVAILISGSGSNMLALVEAMQSGAAPAKPALVLSNNPDATGLQKAASKGVPTAGISHKPFGKDRPAFEAALNEALHAHGTDLICLAGFMRILTPGFIAHWQGRMINIHPSLLPKYPGLNTHARAIDAGDAQAGCTTHMVTEELDAGPILGQRAVPIAPDDTPETLAARVLKEEHILYPETLAGFIMSQ